MRWHCMLASAPQCTRKRSPEALHFKVTYICRLTPAGNAFPINAPWGNTGITTNAVCMAALYHKMRSHVDSAKEQQLLRRVRCFMHRQLAFLTNHKCDSEHEACSTAGAGGFAYLAGCALPILSLVPLFKARCSTTKRRCVTTFSHCCRCLHDASDSGSRHMDARCGVLNRRCTCAQAWAGLPDADTKQGRCAPPV